MLNNILTWPSLDMTQASLVCLGVALLLGIFIAFIYMYRNTYTKSFVITLALLPAMVQTVIMLVNGNLGVGVAVMGTFSLVRFRSVPGSANEICAIFFAMAVGLATGMGLVFYAIAFTAIIGVAMLLYHTLRFGEGSANRRLLKIIIPEDLDYTDVFTDIFAKYTRTYRLERIQTTNLGSLFELRYTVMLKDVRQEKEMLDQIRQRRNVIRTPLFGPYAVCVPGEASGIC